jgi:MFS family permease
LLGGVVGGLSGGSLAATLGRRRLIFLDNICFVASGLLFATASSVTPLYWGRFIAGVGAGAGTVVVPLYISEITPLDLRGTLGSLNQLAIVLGVLVAQLFGIVWSTRESWRLLLGLTIGRLSVVLTLVLVTAF